MIFMKRRTIFRRLTAICATIAIMVGAVPVFASNAVPVARYVSANTAKMNWEVNNPFPLSSTTLSSGETALLNDGSSIYPSEAYLQMNPVSDGRVIFDFDFEADRLMEDMSFRFLNSETVVTGIISDASGHLYLEEPNGAFRQLCNYSANQRYNIKMVLDMTANTVVLVQINGETCEQNRPFVTSNLSINGFSARTTEAAQGMVAIKDFYADKDYYVYDDFINPAGTIPDDWTYSGSCTLHAKNATTHDKNDVCLGANSTIYKTIPQVSGSLTFAINVLQPAKGGSFAITLWGGSSKVSEITSDGTYYYRYSTSGTTKTFAEFAANVYNNIRLDLNTETKKADVYFNNVMVKNGIPFNESVRYVDKISITTESGCNPVYIDDVMLSDTRVYEADYPTIDTIPEKKSGTPLVSMEVCPMWTQGQHYGWDYINQASDKRKSVLGYYDEANPESIDWMIKYMKEHGVDYMNICMYPPTMSDDEAIITQPTDKSVRCTGFINSYLNSRYKDQINFAIFLELNSLKSFGSDYYDDFFEVLLPHYIEMYLKNPQYQKINGRPILGIYALEVFKDIMDTGNKAQGSTRDARIKNGIQRIRDICIASGVGNPYLVANQSFQYVAPAADYGFDAVTAYNYSVTSDFSVQKRVMENALAKSNEKGIDFIPAIMPCCNHVAWRTRAGFAYTGEEFTSQLNWINNTLISGYTPSNSGGTKIVNMAVWDEYGEGQILAPTEGNGFMYLDSIRSAFTNGGSHTDAVPNAAQKARINNMYAQDRKVNNVLYEIGDEDERHNVGVIREVYFDKVEREIENGIPGTVVKKFDFKNSEDADKVSAAYQIGSDGEYIAADTVSAITKSSQGIVVTPASIVSDNTTVRPTITISDVGGIDAHNITYIKIRMKKNPTATSGAVYWTSNFYSKPSTGRAVFFDEYSGSSSSFADYYVPVYESAAWAGYIDSIDIALGNVSDTSTDFVIDSVELLADTSIDDGFKVVTKNQTATVSDGFDLTKSEVMVPLYQVGYILGAKSINMYASEGKYVVKYGNLTADFTLGSLQANVEGYTVSLTQAPYRASDNVTDTVYIPITLLEKIFYNLDIEYDTESKTLTAVPDVPDSDRVIKDVTFDTAGDMIRALHVTVLKNSSDGILKVLSTSSDPQLYVNNGTLDSSEVKNIEVRLWSDTATQMELFFKTDQDDVWNGSKRAFAVVKQGYNVIEIDTGSIDTWQDNITEIRIDPSTAEGVTTVLDSVAFLTEKIVTPDPVIPPVIPEKNAYKPYYTLNKGQVISVYGKVEERSLIGKFVTVLLLDKNTDIENLLPTDIKNIAQCRVESDGKYKVVFSCPNNVSPSDCVIYTRVGTRKITESETTAYMSINEFIDYSASITQNANNAEITVTVSDPYGFNASEYTFQPIMAFYDNSGNLTGIKVAEINTTSASETIPAGADKMKAFVWESINVPIPLYSSQSENIE